MVATLGADLQVLIQSFFPDDLATVLAFLPKPLSANPPLTLLGSLAFTELFACKPSHSSSSVTQRLIHARRQNTPGKLKLAQEEHAILTGLVADSISKEHLTGLGHPERPERFDAALNALAGLHLERIPARLANKDEILLCHTSKYVRLVEHEIMTGFHILSTGDTVISPRSMDAALSATGAALNAVDNVINGKVKNAFCVVRPPGHHATPDRGMGFCIFNSVAIAARYAQRKYGVSRVLIADWDVHHGNGTQDIFYSDGTVLFLSTHQYPWYPGTGAANETGEGAGEGWTINAPFPAGAGRKEILGAFQQRLIPAADRVKPELVLLSAGFDSRAGDPLGQFQLDDTDFRDLTKVVLEIADKHAGGRLVSILEGGYNLNGLGSAVRAHVEALISG